MHRPRRGPRAAASVRIVEEPILVKLISGGQTGVDRGALDAAIDAGFPCGGWAPDGRLAEDGPIHERYPLAELKGSGYEERTLANVLGSDGTAIVYFGDLEGGTRLTRDYCVARSKPFELVDASAVAPPAAALTLAAFITRFRVAVLNIAGPRASKVQHAHAYSRDMVSHLLRIAGLRRR
jgi:hypothetical protein